MATESDLGSWLQEELEGLRRMRDELRVQVHLAKAEVRDRWNDMEEALDALESRAKHAARVAEEPLQQLEEDARKLVADLRDGYQRIRASL